MRLIKDEDLQSLEEVKGCITTALLALPYRCPSAVQALTSANVALHEVLVHIAELGKENPQSLAAERPKQFELPSRSGYLK